MQFLNVLTMITLVWHNVSEIILEFPLFVQPALQSYPNLTCSCLRGGNLMPIIGLCMTMIVCYKIFLTLDSTCYLSMDHERIFKIGLGYAISHYVIEHLFLTLKYGTICVKAKVQQLIFVKGVNLQRDHFNTAFMVFPVHVIFLVIATLGLKISKCYKQKTCRAIHKFKQIFCCRNHKTKNQKPNSKIYSISQNLPIPSVAFIAVSEAERTITDLNTKMVYCNEESKQLTPIYKDILETNSKLRENGKRNCIINQDETVNAIESIDTIEVINLDDSNNKNLSEIEPGDNSFSTNTETELPQINVKSKWIKHQNLSKAPSQVSIVDNAKITGGITLAVVAAIIILIVINSKNSGLSSLVTIINALGIHISPIAWVLNSSEITDYMIRRIKSYL